MTTIQKILFTVLILVVFRPGIRAQESLLSAVDTLKLSAFDQLEKGEWADMNNDGKLDLVLLARKGDVYQPLLIEIDNDTMISVDTLDFTTSVGGHFAISDIDNDGRLDFLHTFDDNGVTFISINYQTTSLTFQNSGVLDSLDTVVGVDVADIDNDGKKDVIYYGENSGSPKFNVLVNEGSNSWSVIDIPEVAGAIDNLLLLDANSDGLTDMLVSGTEAGQPITALLFNRGGSFEKSDEELVPLSKAHFAHGDFNGDGSFDALISGKDAQNEPHTIFRAGGEVEIPLDTLQGHYFIDLFLADFNTDGICDMALRGENANRLILSDSVDGYLQKSLAFGFEKDDVQLFGDYDWDGDLDLIAFKNNPEPAIILFKNKTASKNHGPSIPTNNVAFSISDGVRIVWESSVDDHTSSESITYDVFIGLDLSSAEVLSPNFDLNNAAFRTMVRHGNSGLREEITIRSVDPGLYSYGIQSIDNAFYTIACEGGGAGVSACNNLPIACGTFIVCENINFTNIDACGETPLEIPGFEGGAWYSMNEGFLGFADTLSHVFVEKDTVYNTVSGASSCEQNKAWVVTPVEYTPVGDTVVCAGQTFTFNMPFAYDNMAWESVNGGTTPGPSDLELIVHNDDALLLTISKGSCSFYDTIAFKVSKPELQLAAREFRILKGDKVQLNASGATEYRWSPAIGLNRNDIASPVASPPSTTRYGVQAFDSIGCVTVDSVLILVDDQAFIPNLFTPNEDGNNDVLLIYGLNPVSDFDFRIYDRSGSLVYQTANAHEATTSGWNGTINGAPQPNGVYYWKVSGQLASGNKLLLGGRESGAVHLMR